MLASAVNFAQRWKKHRSELRSGKHHSNKLQRAWQKHGEQGILFEILEVVHQKEILIQAEQQWIDKLNAFNAGYNSRMKAESNLGAAADHQQGRRQLVRHVRDGSGEAFGQNFTGAGDGGFV